MRKFIFICLLFIMSNMIQANAFAFSDLNNILNYAENQIFNMNYKNNDPITRLERLESSVYGAIQSGSIISRIDNMKKAVANVSAGGFGLNNLSKITNFIGNGMTGYNYSTGYNYYPYYTNNYHGHLSRGYSHRIPPRHYHSHIVYPRNSYNYNNIPDNGDFSKNYSMGASIKILDD